MGWWAFDAMHCTRIFADKWWWIGSNVEVDSIGKWCRQRHNKPIQMNAECAMQHAITCAIVAFIVWEKEKKNFRLMDGSCQSVIWFLLLLLLFYIDIELRAGTRTSECWMSRQLAHRSTAAFITIDQTQLCGHSHIFHFGFNWCDRRRNVSSASNTSMTTQRNRIDVARISVIEIAVIWHASNIRRE